MLKNENKMKYARDLVISMEIKKVEEKMAGGGRVLIRVSGTEPLVRVMLEGQNIEAISEMASELADLITSRLG